MARALWSGSLSLGLVNIPVKLVTAVTEKELHFHMIHGKDGARLKFRRFCPVEDKEVDTADIVRGYELSKGHYVTFTDTELQAADPKAARTIDIEEFVDLDEVDPVYFDKPYFLVPDKNAQKPYSLMLAALAETNKAGIARMVMRDKEYLVVVRAKGPLLMLETMRFAEEVAKEGPLADEAGVDPGHVDAKQLKLAKQLIESLTLPFDPERHHNTHRAKVMALIEAKAAGEEIIAEPTTPEVHRTVDILAALEKSLASTRARGGKAGGGAKAGGTRESKGDSKAARPARRSSPAAETDEAAQGSTGAKTSAGRGHTRERHAKSGRQAKSAAAGEASTHPAPAHPKAKRAPRAD